MTYDDNTKKQFPSSHEMMVSRVWPDWKIIKRLGRGAYGVVYEVERDDVVRSRAALKIISFPQMESDLDALRTNEGLTEPEVETYLNHVKENFVREIQIMFSFRGLQNIVSVEDYKVLPRSEGPGFDILIRMELLTSLTEYMKENRLSEEEVIRLGTEICTALEMCAKKHVIHRDVKPDNI
ncbi:MAG: protein kinase, partial [Lachnospiraceae bacterium]|nr:protein kinase [Lachnospiraceae bacterium]